MPKVPERQLSYGEILDKQRREEAHQAKLARKRPFVRLPRRKRHFKKTKLRDPTIFQNAYDQREHLRSIMREV